MWLRNDVTEVHDIVTGLKRVWLFHLPVCKSQEKVRQTSKESGSSWQEEVILHDLEHSARSSGRLAWKTPEKDLLGTTWWTNASTRKFLPVKVLKATDVLGWGGRCRCAHPVLAPLQHCA